MTNEEINSTIDKSFKVIIETETTLNLERVGMDSIHLGSISMYLSCILGILGEIAKRLPEDKK